MEDIFENSLKSFKEKIKCEETAFDSVDMEKCLREFKTELYIKRDQVKQLRNDLEVATNEIKYLKKALDTSSKALEEKNFNLNLITKKFRTTEDELMEKVDTLNTVQMQHKLTVVEIEKLNESFQKNEAEKLELSRKLEVFETKQRQSFIYHNQIIKRETNLKSTMEEVQEMVNKLQTELSVVTELSKKTKIAEDSLERFEQLSQNYNKTKKEKDYFEELYTKISAKYEMLEELLNLKENLKEPNLMNKIIFNQWKSNRIHYEKQLEENNKIINNLSECYNNEKLVNLKLIQKNDELTEEDKNLHTKLENQEQEMKNYKQQISELEEQLKNALQNTNVLQNTREKIEIKDEPIEILDD